MLATSIPRVSFWQQYNVRIRNEAHLGYEAEQNPNLLEWLTYLPKDFWQNLTLDPNSWIIRLVWQM